MVTEQTFTVKCIENGFIVSITNQDNDNWDGDATKTYAFLTFDKALNFIVTQVKDIFAEKKNG